MSRLARSGPWMAGVVALLAMTVTVGTILRERTFLAGIPTARNDAPNVLLITLDTLRADHVSAYGYSRPTPALDRLAAEGLQFDYAIATASWTLPSHATMMTGLLTHEHDADMTGAGRLDERYHTLAEAFSRMGMPRRPLLPTNMLLPPTRVSAKGSVTSTICSGAPPIWCGGPNWANEFDFDWGLAMPRVAADRAQDCR